MKNRTRRQFLRGTGVALALPLLDAFAPRMARAAARGRPGYSPDGVPRRMVAICNNLGLYTPFFVPEQAGTDYEAPRYLKILEDLRHDFTVFSGVSHPEVDGFHISEKCFLTAAPHPGRDNFKNLVSVDQYAVDFVGDQTRFPSLVLTANGNQSLSWTHGGVPIPGEKWPSEVFRKLFMTGDEGEVAAQIRKLRQGRSIMDVVLDQARSLEGALGAEDRLKFDEYVTSVRDVEKALVRRQEWERRPRPTVDAGPPEDIRDDADVTGRERLMFDLTHLALETDSTRLVTIFVEGFFIVPPIEGVSQGYHTLTHHGKSEEKIEQLAIIESEHMKALRDFLLKLKGSQEEGETLLDRTMTLYGSNLGNASNHDTRNMPILLAGGGFRHGRHLAFDKVDNYPLPRLFVSMLQRMGIETDSFASGKGTMSGLEAL